jgi:hypothetical protein
VRVRASRFAGDEYAGYLCDHCHEPVGDDGTVVLASGKPVVVWSSWCAAHAGARRPNPTFDPKVDRPERFTDGPI